MTPSDSNAKGAIGIPSLKKGIASDIAFAAKSFSHFCQLPRSIFSKLGKFVY